MSTRKSATFKYSKTIQPMVPEAPMSSQTSEAIVVVIDPLVKAGKLRIPIGKTMPTKGRDEWLAGRLNKDLSLCCLFHKGRCFADTKCFQVHVDRDLVEKLREEHASVQTCCRSCGDTASFTHEASKFFRVNFPYRQIVVSENDEQLATIEVGRVAFTEGLVSNVMKSQKYDGNCERLTVSTRAICRLHLKGCCKYGKDCKNIHACASVADKLLPVIDPKLRHPSPPSPQALTPKPTPAKLLSSSTPSPITSRSVSVEVVSLATPPPQTLTLPAPQPWERKQEVKVEVQLVHEEDSMYDPFKCSNKQILSLSFDVSPASTAGCSIVSLDNAFDIFDKVGVIAPPCRILDEHKNEFYSLFA